MPLHRLLASSVLCIAVLFLAGGCAQQAEPPAQPEPSVQKEPSAKPQACVEYPGLAALMRDNNSPRAWSVGRRYGAYQDVLGRCYGLFPDGGYSISDCNRLLRFHNLLEPAAESDRREIRAELLANKCGARINRPLQAIKGTCDAAVESSPTNPLARFSRGRFHMESGNWDAAIADFSVGIVHSPCFLPPFLYRSYAYLRDDRFPEAQSDLDTLLAGKSDVLPALILQELLRYRWGDRDGALSGLERLNSTYPEYDGAHALRAQLLANEGEFGAALAAIDEAIRRDSLPRSAIWRIIRGKIRLAMGATAEAVADFRQAVAIDGRREEYRFGLATALSCSGRLAEAVPAFDLAKARAGLWNSRYYKAGWVARAWILGTASDDGVRDGNAALKDALNFWASPLNGVTDTDRLYSDAIELEAVSRAEIGKFEEAVELQRKAIDAALRNQKPERTISEMRARLDLYESRQPYRTKTFCPEPPPEDPYRWLLEEPWHTQRKINPFDSAVTDPILSGGFTAQGTRPCARCTFSPPHS